MIQTTDNSTKRTILTTIVAITISGIVGLQAECAAADEKKEEAKVETVRAEPCHVRVIWTKDPTTAARISWNTSEEGSKHQLHIRKKGTSTFRKMNATSGLYSYGDKKKDKKGVPLAAYFHRVEVDGLTSATNYEIQCVSDNKSSPVHFFVTAPNGQGGFSLLYGGDSRSDRVTRQKMNGLVAKFVSESESSKDPANRIVGFMHGGDYAASGTDLQQWIDWMADHENTTTRNGRLIPLIPTRGNHDRGRLFNESFGFASKDTRNYYGISFGSMLRVVTLNTETSIAGDQAIWLRNELSDSVPKHRWVVPQYHRPGYAAVKIPGGALAHWVPIFEEFDLKLVCEADGHVIKRTLPIRRGKHDESGVVYIGEGGMGVGQRTPKKKRWFLQSPGMCGAGHHIMRLKFTSDQLTYECIGLDDNETKIIDRWEFAARP